MKAISFLSYQQDASAWAAKYAGCKVRGPTQSARTHAKCADPRKVRGPMQSTWAAFWVRGALSVQIRTKCVGRGSIAWAALSAWAAIARSGEWAALSTHLPRTCRAMPTQCNRGSTHVGRNEPQSSGMLRVNMAQFPCKLSEYPSVVRLGDRKTSIEKVFFKSYYEHYARSWQTFNVFISDVTGALWWFWSPVTQVFVQQLINNLRPRQNGQHGRWHIYVSTN